MGLSPPLSFRVGEAECFRVSVLLLAPVVEAALAVARPAEPRVGVQRLLTASRLSVQAWALASTPLAALRHHAFLSLRPPSCRVRHRAARPVAGSRTARPPIGAGMRGALMRRRPVPWAHAWWRLNPVDCRPHEEGARFVLVGIELRPACDLRLGRFLPEGAHLMLASEPGDFPARGAWWSVERSRGFNSAQLPAAPAVTRALAANDRGKPVADGSDTAGAIRAAAALSDSVVPSAARTAADMLSGLPAGLGARRLGENHLECRLLPAHDCGDLGGERGMAYPSAGLRP